MASFAVQRMAADLPSATVNAPSERSRELSSWLTDYARRRIQPRLIDERRCIPPHVVLDFGNRGVLAMQVPRVAGGLLEFNHREACWVLGQLGAIDFTLAAFVGLNNCLGVRPIARFGTPALRERYLPSLASGRILGAFALTEAGAGSDPAGVTAVAARTSNGFRLSGEKWWSGSAQWAGVINVVARHHDAAGRACGFVALSVDGDQRGVEQGEESLTLGLRGMVQNRVRFNDTDVDTSQVLGSPFAGMSVAADTMGFGRLVIGAVASGALWRLLQLMLRYAERRRVGGGLLYCNDHVQSVILEHWRAASALDLLVQRVAEALDAQISLPVEIQAAVKLLSTELLWAAADSAMQLVGGRAYSENNPIAQLWRDARITRVFEGPSETLAAYLGRQVLSRSSPLITHLEALDVDQVASLQGLIDPCRSASVPPPARTLIALGQATAWTVLGIYAGATPELKAWVESKRADAARVVAAGAIHLPSSEVLRELIERRLGHIEVNQVGEERRIDPYLDELFPG